MRPSRTVSLGVRLTPWLVGWLLTLPAHADIRLVNRELAPPHFQLNLPGQTATVQALACLPVADSGAPLLISAGRDKLARTWELGEEATPLGTARDITLSGSRPVPARPGPVLRWQIGPGPKGSVYCLAVRPTPLGTDLAPLVAMAGDSVSGSGGLIVLVDPQTARTRHALDGHRQSVTSLDFSPNGRHLVSTSAEGQVLLWTEEGGRWTSREIIAPDANNAAYRASLKDDEQRREFLQHLRKVTLRSSMFLDDRHLLVSRVDAGRWPKEREAWKRMQATRWLPSLLDVATGEVVWTSLQPLQARFSAPLIAAAPAVRRFAVGTDFSTRVTCWKWEPPAAPRQERVLTAPLGTRSLAYSREGSRLAVGSLASADAGTPSRLDLWSTETWQGRMFRAGSQAVSACAFSPDGAYLAFAGGTGEGIHLRELAGESRFTLRGPLRPITRVAFEDRAGSYQVAWSTADDGTLTHAADITQLRHEVGDRVPAGSWRTHAAEGSDWQAEIVERDQRKFVRIRRGGRDFHAIRFDPAVEDAACYCWIPDPAGDYRALAVGTSRTNHIYVYGVPREPAAGQPWPCLRGYRGHTDRVLSIGASADGKYLVSGGADGTLRYWSLAGSGETMTDLWGAAFDVEERGLRVRRLEKAGPLYLRGVRQGDVVQSAQVPENTRTEQSLPAASTVTAETAGETALRSLSRLTPQSNTNVVFRVQRGERPLAVFQTPPMWPPLVSMLWTSGREWAYWTPPGYFAASSNGDGLFGWQVDRGPGETPDYVRAESMWRQLENKPAIQRLLAAGNLADALAQRGDTSLQDAAAPPIEARVNSTPIVRIENLPARQRTAESTLRVTVRTQVPVGCRLTRKRLFAGGVPGRRLEESESVEEGWLRSVTTWEVPLPPETDVELRAVVEAQTGDTPLPYGMDRKRIRRTHVPPSPRRLYVLTAGVNDYAHLGRIDFAVRDADRLSSTIGQHARPPFEQVWFAPPLRDEEVTADTFRNRLEQFVRHLKEEDAGPNDLAVIFLAGHGIEQDGQYYFAAHNARLVSGGSPDPRHLIPASVFRPLALTVPCRKLALLDTCRNSAVPRVVEASDPSLAMREFRDHMMFTLAACEYGERAFEDPDRKHGLFTAALIEALEGAADHSRDQRVDLPELVGFVEQRVPRMAEGLNLPPSQHQHPAFAPRELLDTIRAPLVESGVRGEARGQGSGDRGQH